MPLRYYKKLGDRQPVLGNGSRCEFTTLDGITSYFSTDNEYIHTEFDRLAKMQMGGITEIQAAEFVADYVEKKTEAPNRLRPPWREELSGLKVTGHRLKPSVEGAVAVDVARTVVPAATVNDAPAPAIPSGKEFKPPAGRRTRRTSENR